LLQIEEAHVMHARTKTTILTPLALKDAPALIESVFPAQKVSFEAQKERKAQASQTLTALGSFWKGRKPLILVRAVVLGALLPATDDPERDLDVFERLMAFDEESLARRALANNAFNIDALQKLIPINDWERYFSSGGWRRDIGLDEKLELYRPAVATFGSYEEKAACANDRKRSIRIGCTNRSGRR
jgi:putative DNA methylase